jgi:hypothetical protein
VELSLHLGVVWLRNGNVNENEIFPRWNGKEIVDCVFFLGFGYGNRTGREWNGLLTNSNVIDVLKRGMDYPAT